MAMKILTRLPFSEARSEVATPGGIAEVKPYQIIVMVSITSRNVTELDPGVPRIPAILDTGHNHNLAIRRAQLDRWVTLKETERGQIRVGDVRLLLVPANVWIHPNRPGTREAAGRPPFKLELKEGIAVYPPGVTNPARLAPRPARHRQERFEAGDRRETARGHAEDERVVLASNRAGGWSR